MEYKELSQEELDKFKLNEWLKTKVGMIWDVMEEERVRKYDDIVRAHSIPGVGQLARGATHGGLYDFSPATRLPSEMPLCEVWKRLEDSGIEPPEGFEVRLGTANFGPKDKLNKGIRHFFLTHVDSRIPLIVDACAGQFVHVKEGILRKSKPGDRLKTIQDKAPEMFKTYQHPHRPQISQNAVTFLIGNLTQIERQIGLQYHVYKNS